MQNRQNRYKIGNAILIMLMLGCRNVSPSPGNHAPPPPPGVSAEQQITADLKEDKTSVTRETASGFSSVRIGLGSVHRVLEKDKTTLYPVLRNCDENETTTRALAHVSVAPGLAVFAYLKVERPNGRVGMDYILKKQLDDYGLTEAQLIELCYDNFYKTKITVHEYRQEKNRMFGFSTEGAIITAILGDPKTNAKFAEMLNATEMAVLIVNPDTLLVTTKGSSFEAKFDEIAKEARSKVDVISLNPAVYHWAKGGSLVLISDKRSSEKKP